MPFQFKGPQLTTTGCSRASDYGNCTAACTRPTLVFTDLATLANCMTYGKVADLLAKDVLVTDGKQDQSLVASILNLRVFRYVLFRYCQLSKSQDVVL